jgi:hypothetical protein
MLALSYRAFNLRPLAFGLEPMTLDLKPHMEWVDDAKLPTEITQF